MKAADFYGIIAVALVAPQLPFLVGIWLGGACLVVCILAMIMGV